MHESTVIAMILVLVTISINMLTGLFSYLWSRCLPTKAKDSEILSELSRLEQRLDELEAKHKALAVRLLQQSDPERPIALSSSGGPVRFGAVSPGRSSLEQNPWAV